MYMCDDGHDEIVYDCKNCPLCESQNEVAALEVRVDELIDEKADLESMVEEMENK